jgi:hypothetical protein
VAPDPDPGPHPRSGYSRVEFRIDKVAIAPGVGFPLARQAIHIARSVRPLGGRRWRTVMVDAVTSLATIQAHPA